MQVLSGISGRSASFFNSKGTDGKLLMLEISISRNVDLSKSKSGVYVKYELQLNGLRNKDL